MDTWIQIQNVKCTEPIKIRIVACALLKLWLDFSTILNRGRKNTSPKSDQWFCCNNPHDARSSVGKCAEMEVEWVNINKHESLWLRQSEFHRNPTSKMFSWYSHQKTVSIVIILPVICINMAHCMRHLPFHELYNRDLPDFLYNHAIHDHC